MSRRAFPIGQLGECHRKKLIPAGETFQIGIAAVAQYTFVKLFARQVLDQLGENRTAKVHPPLCRVGMLRSGGHLRPRDFKSFPGKTGHKTLSGRRLTVRWRNFPRTALGGDILPNSACPGTGNGHGCYRQHPAPRTLPASHTRPMPSPRESSKENDRAGGWSLRVGRSLPHGYGNRADMYLAGQSCDLIPWARPIW